MSREFKPNEAVSRYLKERKHNLSEATLYNYQSNLGAFVDWCDENVEIRSVSDIDQFHVADFRLYKQAQGVADTTLYNVMMNLRTFLKWCENKGLLDGVA